MDGRTSTARLRFRRFHTPARLDPATRAEVEALIRRRIPDVGFVVRDAALGQYSRYPIMTLAYAGGRLVGYHGMSIRPLSGRWLANLGSLYVERGQRAFLGQQLICMSALPILLRHPTWPLVYYTLTRSPRVVAAGRRWLDPFYPDPFHRRPPPSQLLEPVLADLALRGESLLDPGLLALGPPGEGWTAVPLGARAWSGDPHVDTFMREALGPDGDRRVLVLGEVGLTQVLGVMIRAGLGRRRVERIRDRPVVAPSR